MLLICFRQFTHHQPPPPHHHSSQLTLASTQTLLYHQPELPWRLRLHGTTPLRWWEQEKSVWANHYFLIPNCLPLLSPQHNNQLHGLPSSLSSSASSNSLGIPISINNFDNFRESTRVLHSLPPTITTTPTHPTPPSPLPSFFSHYTPHIPPQNAITNILFIHNDHIFSFDFLIFLKIIF